MAQVLLTGSSGFLGTHILNLLLEKQYSILAIVRSKEKGRALLTTYPSVEYAIIPDITTPGAFDQLLKSNTTNNIKYVIHSASPFFYGHSDPEKELLQPAIKGTTELLHSLHKYAPSVERVVLTSSFAAIIGDPSCNGIVNESQWNPITYEGSLEAENTYIGSKKLAEKAAWEFVQNTPGVGFSLTTVNPALIFGPLLQLKVNGDGDGKGKVNTSTQVLAELVQGKHAGNDVPETVIPGWVDVRDVALAHVKALEEDGARNERFLLCAGFYTYEKVVQIMREQFPELQGRLPIVGESQDGGGPPIQIDGSKAVSILGVDYVGLEDCVRDTVKSLLE